MTTWVVLVELESRNREAMGLLALRSVASSFEARPALHHPDRCAVQLRAIATNPGEALREALTCLEDALVRLRLPWIVKRIEVFTADELERELAAEHVRPDRLKGHALQPLPGLDTVAKQLLKDVFTDPVTGLATRDVLRGEVLDLLAPSLPSETKHAVVGIELRGLRALDETSDEIGDSYKQVLLIVARVLRRALRPGDTVAHIGHHRFGILLRHASSDAAAAVTERVLRRLARIRVPGRDLALEPIAGMAVVRGGDADTILANVDAALSAQGESARSQAVMFGPEIRNSTGR